MTFDRSLERMNGRCVKLHHRFNLLGRRRRDLGEQPTQDIRRSGDAQDVRLEQERQGNIPVGVGGEHGAAKFKLGQADLFAGDFEGLVELGVHGIKSATIRARVSCGPVLEQQARPSSSVASEDEAGMFLALGVFQCSRRVTRERVERERMGLAILDERIGDLPNLDLSREGGDEGFAVGGFAEGILVQSVKGLGNLA